MNAGDNQTAPMGTTVAIPPSVLVTDKNGAPMLDVAVTFTPTLGSGSVTGPGSYGPSVIFTGADGIATANEWLLGCNVTNSLVVSLRDYSGVSGDSLTFTASGGVQECWDLRAGMPTRRWNLGVAAVNGIVYAVGGWVGHLAPQPVGTVEAYNPSTDTWTTKASMPTDRSGLDLVAFNGILYAVGGAGSHTPQLSVVEAYDPSTDTWTTKTPPIGSGFAFAAGNGILYAFGGCAVAPCPAQAYDPTTDTWTMKASMATSRYVSWAGVVNDTIYVLGSCDAPPCAVQAYDPGTDSWSSRALIPQLVGSSFVVINAILYSFAELDFFSGLRSGYLTTVAYDPATDTWTTKASWPLGGRRGSGAAAIDGTAYVVGGVNNAYQAASFSGAYHP